MRMTNKIMQNNSLYNINNNKMLQNQLSTQMATQKKVTRPSDDPVVAIRALRLRSDVSQISQYYEKNAPDAESWLKVTGDALNLTSDVITDLLKQCTQGANKDLTYENLDIILTQMKALKEEFYATGNVDYAGRYVFAGYRTDTTLSYTEDTTQNFSITEKLDLTAIDKLNYTNISDLEDITKENFDPTKPVSEDKISSGDIYRIRLSYDDLKDGKPTIKYVSDADTVPPTETDLIPPGDITTVSLGATPNPYDEIQKPENKGKAIFVPETGELLMGKDLHESIQTTGKGKELRVTYEKDQWVKGDMRPQHYFACQDQTDPGNTVSYNYEKKADGTSYIPTGTESQIIEYDVGYNQKIRINSTAGEVFGLDLDRNIDDLESALRELKKIDASKKNLSGMLDGMKEGEANYASVQKTYYAAEKAYNSIRENVQKMFGGMITKTQKVLDKTGVAITDCGTRASRLDLVSNRLMTQKTTFKTLQSENEDIDVTEVTIQLTSMEFSYQSALLATGKIMQNSLMNYI